MLAISLLSISFHQSDRISWNNANNQEKLAFGWRTEQKKKKAQASLGGKSPASLSSRFKGAD